MRDPDSVTDAEVFAAFPGVLIDRDNVEHYRGLVAGRLLINRCQACGCWIYPHRPLCPKCLSWDVRPTEVSGEGHVFMFTLIHQERDPNGLLNRPIVAAAVELAEQPGLRYLAPVVGCEVDEIRLEMPVRLTWIEQGGRMAPAFEPAPAGEA
ncbi:OB-fold domain-containing protein [Phenylobacterium sp. LjRoot225]|uniref:Zn-ribbon domain-containing OB-fold protein n=1 Tax=Phenylobacterium sp. LjRoot225 TaxID=3342285 RepID=UPI003ECCA6F4